MKLYQFKPALSVIKQTELYNQYKLTGDEDYKVKITISYVKVISAMVDKMYFNQDKEDVISEMLMIVYNSIDKYDQTKASIFTYLYRIIYCKTIDKYRKANRIRKYKVEFDVDELLKSDDELNHNHTVSQDYSRVIDGQKELETIDNTKGITKAIETLNPREQQLINLRYFNHEPISNCMKIMHVSRKSYGEIEVKALNKLKRNKIIQEIKKVNYE